MKKQQNFNFVFFTVFLLLPFSLCWAGGKKDNNAQTQKQQTVTVVSASSSLPTVYWTGDGGKNIKIAVLEPTGKGLSASEQWMLSMIQSSITGDFQKFSAMTIIDRQNLEKILKEQNQSMSGNYSDYDYISIGKLTNTRYILAGSLTKTANAFMLELALTDAETGERKASYPPKAVSPLAIENLSAVKEATAELLKQLGIQLTNAGLQELNSTVNIAQVKAETALAKGIEAQKQGTVVEALSYYIQAANYNTGLAEAASRMNILNTNITSGNIGADTRNDIAWRKQWVTRLQEAETFFTNSLKVQPFYIVYSTNIKQGKIDYQKETTDLSIWMGFYPDFVWAEQINEVINAVKMGLQKTGRSQVWELDWPTKSISSPSPFANQTKNSISTVIVEIINSEGKSIGKQTVKSPYGFESKAATISPLWQWEGDVFFTGVNANLITDKLEIKITTIDGITAETAAKQKSISVMPLTEWDSMLQRNAAIKGNIAIATQKIQLNPNDVDEYCNRGFEYLDLKYYNNAIADFTQAIRINPKYYIAYYHRGVAYHSLGDYNNAIADYTQAIRNSGYFYESYNNRGLAYHSLGDYNNAIADYTQAIRINPNYAVYNNRGIAYNDLHDYNNAITDLTRAIRFNPSYSEAYNNRGFAYQSKGDKAHAIADYETAVRLDPNNTVARDNLKRLRGW